MTAQARLPLVNGEQLGTPRLSLGALKAHLAAWVETCVDYHQEAHRDRRGPALLSFVSDLGSGSIRELADNDLQSYRHHLLRLSRRCRRSRFGNEVNDNFLRDYVARVDLTNTVVLGYFAEGAMRGAAELRSLRNVWCDEAETAFSVKRQIAPRVLARL